MRADGGFGDLRRRKHVVDLELLRVDVLLAVTGREVVDATDVLELRFGLAALVDDQGAARGERASRGQRGERRRVALDRRQGRAAVLVDAWNRSEQPHRVRHARLVVDLVGGADLDRLAGVHDHHAIREAGDDAEVVGDHDDRRTGLALRGLQYLEDLRLDGHVQSGRRFVGDDHVRVVGDGHGDHHALPHTAGELVREGVGALLRVRDADEVEQLDRASCAWLLGHAVVVDQQRLGDLLPDGVDGGEGRQRLLEDHRHLLAADLGQLPVVEREQFTIAEPHRSGDPRVRGQQPHHCERRDRLARPGLAHDRQHLAAAQREVQPAHGVHVRPGTAGKVTDRSSTVSTASVSTLRVETNSVISVVTGPSRWTDRVRRAARPRRG